MSTLLVDIGNTRAKWAVLTGKRMSAMRAVVHEGSASAMERVVHAAPHGITKVVAVCVASAAFERALAVAARKRFAVDTSFIRSARLTAGVRNAYREPWRLGADRWVGAIAAHHLARGRAALVVNVGTALTIDLVAANGKHAGGVIIPGPDGMIDKLLSGTHGIRRRAQGGTEKKPATLFARDTRAALASGAVNAAAALIERARAEASWKLRADPQVFLSGGAAPAVRRFLEKPARYEPALVLRGLAILEAC
jgi:type III pantothenate kinase